MNCFQQEYQSKLRTREETYELIQDGDYVVFGAAGSEPMAFCQGFHSIADRVHHVHISDSLEMGRYQFLTDEAYRGIFSTDSFFLMGPGREAVRAGRKEYIPGNLHDCCKRQIDVNDIDVFVCAVPPMDDMGYFRFSLSNIGESLYAAAAKRVILEVVPDMPVFYGDNEIHISDVDAVFECRRPYPVLPEGTLTEEDRMIGKYVAPLVEDGSTIQLGIGSIPDAIAQAFMDKHDLGVHTEMITSSIADLVEAGVVTGKYKTLHRGKIVGTFALGNQKLYDMMNRNPAVCIMPGSYVNDPCVIAKNHNMVSINTAIAVDFGGQVASESIGPVQYSGSGGQSDTAIGAIHAKGGKSIIALHSTAKDGTISTIMPFLPQGAVVTLSRNNIDYIVTEYGVAEMKARTTAQRAKNLIAIAHPKFRDELTAKARELGFELN